MGGGLFRAPSRRAWGVFGSDDEIFTRVYGPRRETGPLSRFTYGLANIISWDVPARRPWGGVGANQWAHGLLTRLAASDRHLVYAQACMQAEYETLNMHLDHRFEHIGRNIARALPGVYWLNYFGGIACEAMGLDRAAQLGFNSASAGPGLLVQGYENPLDWNTDIARRGRLETREQLGRQFFFGREEPNYPTISPFAHLIPPDPEPPRPANRDQ